MTKKKPAKKKPVRKTKAKRTIKPLRRFEGRQLMVPGIAPKKAPKPGTYIPPTVAGEAPAALVTAPAKSLELRHVERRRPMHDKSTFSARMELRIMPAQANAWDLAAAHARLSRAQWIRSVCDAAIAGVGK